MPSDAYFTLSMFVAAVVASPLTAGMSQISIRIVEMKRGAYGRNILAAVLVNVAVGWIVFFGLVYTVVTEILFLALASFLPAFGVAFAINRGLLYLDDGTRVSRGSALLAALFNALVGAPAVGLAVLLITVGLPGSGLLPVS